MSGRYVIYGVWGDGVPQELGRSNNLGMALHRRDDRRKGRVAVPPHFGVFDSDDPERGDLDWSDHGVDRAPSSSGGTR